MIPLSCFDAVSVNRLLSRQCVCGRRYVKAHRPVFDDHRQRHNSAGDRGPVSKTINAGSSYTVSLSDFSSQANLQGGTPDSIEITPAPTGAGVWLNSSAPFTGTTVIPSSAIGNLKFSANEAGTAAFTWRVSNEAGFSDYGSGTITVKSIAKPVITSSVVKSVNLGATLVFSSAISAVATASTTVR